MVGQNEFEELRRVVKQGGDFCKDLATVLQERSELEAHYAKGLSKLSGKLLKASKEATGSVAHAWQAVAVQIDTQAELHRQWSTALAEEVARPLRNSLETQHKIRKSVEVLVEKTTRNLAEWRTAESKAKRQCFSSSKEFEKLQESSAVIVNNNLNTANSTGSNNANSGANGNSNVNNLGSNLALAEVRTRSRLLSVPPMEKDPIKLESKRRKAEEAVRRADIEYYTFCVRSERARLEWESAIRNGSTCLRTLEEEKLSLLRDIAVKYYQYLNELAPRLVQSVESLEDPVKNCSVSQDMHAIVDIRRHAGAEQLLPDFYAEDTSNLMKRERRQEALQKFLYLVNQDLEREKKGAVGIETLAKAIAEAPKIDNAHHDISDKLYYVKSMLLYLEGTRCKVDNALADIEGRQRINNPITQYMRHQRDKQGFPQTILKVPSWAKDECLAFCTGGGSAGSTSPDWNDRGNGDGTSGQHETDFDEFSSQDSGCDHNTDSCGEESNKAPSNLISAPSIGKCRAIYDYDANLFDELTIRTGDVINIHDKQEDGWWLGELNGIIGIFPATYVEEVAATESNSTD
ncbi:Nostrin [Orchesella cincta]|uniref:Nostrin n=1 Tax=Orchesella cincta TaxID=48709 RepID=A0A1D2N8J8_ORCCI|nr:Nostrin [Orchesella cincta]